MVLQATPEEFFQSETPTQISNPINISNQINLTEILKYFLLTILVTGAIVIAAVYVSRR